MDDINGGPGKVFVPSSETSSRPPCFSPLPDMWKVSIGVPAKPFIFTFVPVVKKLQNKITMTEEERSGGKSNENVAVSREGTTGETMWAGDTFKVEKVFIKDSVEGGAGNSVVAGEKNHLDDVSQLQASPPEGTQPGNLSYRVPAGKTASMETAVDKHGGISQQQCHDTAGLSKVSSGCFANSRSGSEDRTSLADSPDLWPTLASSRESILSEGSDKDRGWSAVQLSSVTSPASFSQTVSPCSSVLSGVFSPTVVQIKRHFLEPGSSLIHTPQTCFSSCESLSSSVCPQSPPPRRRPPLTRLSLLTAILRKGRLPVLSSALQRPYTPCWPVSPVTLSFCNACSAASSVASIPLELSSQFSSSVSIDSQSHSHREPSRCTTAPVQHVPPNQPNRAWPPAPVKRCSEQVRSSGTPRWQQAISPPPPKCGTLRQPPLPLFTSNFKCASPPPREDCAATMNLRQTPTSPSHEPKPNNTYTYLKGRADSENKTLVSPTSERMNEQGATVTPKGNRTPNSSLSRLHKLSEQLRSPPLCPPPLQPSQPSGVARTDTASPLPPPQITTGRCKSERSCPDSDSPATSQGSHKAHRLTPSRYTPLTPCGWLSPTSGSPTPTPSPVPPYRYLSPCSSPSMRSTPSPRPGSGISDCSDTEGKKRKTHKIKSSYKSLAAIPTNILLLDQQAIDEQVERGGSDAAETGVIDTHAEMCSPAQLRQQSEELYAVIDDVLARSTPVTSRSQQSSRTSTPTPGLQQSNSSCLKSLGRETKYASLSSLHPPTRAERSSLGPKKTKPGVIRPMTAIPRLRVEDEEEYFSNPFRTCDKKTFAGNKKVETEKGLHYQMVRDEWKPERSLHSVCDLQITEPEDSSD